MISSIMHGKDNEDLGNTSVLLKYLFNLSLFIIIYAIIFA